MPRIAATKMEDPEVQLSPGRWMTEEEIEAIKAQVVLPDSVAPLVLSPEAIAAALGIPMDRLDALRSVVGAEAERANAAIVAKPLNPPVRFWCNRYPQLRFFVDGKKRRFINGKFLAENDREYAAVKDLNRPYIFEGDDLKRPAKCRVCKASYRNQDAFEDHLNSHVVA